MRNPGNTPQSTLESLAMLADGIRKQHLSHDQRWSKIETLGAILETHESYAWSEYLQVLYALHEILYMLACKHGQMTHSEVKQSLRLFAEFARESKDLTNARLSIQSSADNIPF